MANFTPQEIEEMLQEFFNVVGKRQYIGARYVPVFGRRGESSITWDNSAPYEPLTIVLYQGNSYTSRTYVPEGIDITDTSFWANTGNYNAQVEQYRNEVNSYKQSVDLLKQQIVLKFDTLHDLRQSTEIVAGDICYTSGYTAINDGGACFYRISDSGTVDNIFEYQCQNDLIAKTIVTDGHINIACLGGLNGVDISSIIEAVANKKLTAICDGNSTYSISNVEISDDFEILGNGCTFAIETNTNVFDVSDTNYFKIKDIVFRGTPDASVSTSTVNTAITIENVDNVEIIGCEFSGFYVHSGTPTQPLDNFKPVIIRTYDCNVTFNDCYFKEGCGSTNESIIILDSDNTRTCNISNCTFEPFINSPLNLRCGYANLTRNHYICDYARFPTGASIVNVFCKFVYIANERFDGNAYNLYDTSEVGSFVSRKVTIENIDVLESLTSCQDAFIINSEEINIFNVSAISEGSFLNIEHPQKAGVSQPTRIHVNIDNCFVRYSGRFIFASYGAQPIADGSIKISNTTALAQTLTAQNTDNVFVHLAQPGWHMKIVNSRMRCVGTDGKTIRSLFYGKVGAAIYIPLYIQIDNCFIQNGVNDSRIVDNNADYNFTNTPCNLVVDNTIALIKMNLVTSSQLVYSNVSNSINIMYPTIIPTADVGSVESFLVRKVGNIVSVSGTYIPPEGETVAANTTLVTLPDNFAAIDARTLPNPNMPNVYIAGNTIKAGAPISTRMSILGYWIGVA